MAEYKIKCWSVRDFNIETADVTHLPGAQPIVQEIQLLPNKTPVEFLVTGENPTDGPTEFAQLCEGITENGTTIAAGSIIVPIGVFRSTSNKAQILIIGNIETPGGRISHPMVFSNCDVNSNIVFAATDISLPQDGMMKASFARGTLIDTPHGAIAIEQLEDGDEVMSRHGDIQLITGLTRRRHCGLELALFPKRAPVRIMAGALTGGRPGHDLLVSQEHRLVVDDWRAAYLFGEDEILVPAKSLLNNRTVVVENHRSGVEYFDLTVQDHGLVCANGLWAETAAFAAETAVQQPTTVPMAALPHSSAYAFVA